MDENRFLFVYLPGGVESGFPLSILGVVILKPNP